MEMVLSMILWINLFFWDHEVAGSNPVIPVAGWSSLEARQTHNLKVVGSNPTPAISTVMQLVDVSNIAKKYYRLVPVRIRSVGICGRLAESGLWRQT